jgi:hypothetical protein
MDSPIPARQIELLLEELCVDLGFCLPPDAKAHLILKPTLTWISLLTH